MVIADVSRAGNHIVIVGMLVLVAVVAGLVFAAVRLVRRRSELTHSRNERDQASSPHDADADR